MKFNLKKPCVNCPFRRDGGIDLRPGRVKGIISELLADDHNVFYCHKTTNGQYRDDGELGEEGDYHYSASGDESVCMGSIAYLHKEGRLPVAARLALQLGMMDIQDVEALDSIIIDPPQRPTNNGETDE